MDHNDRHERVASPAPSMDQPELPTPSEVAISEVTSSLIEQNTMVSELADIRQIRAKRLRNSTPGQGALYPIEEMDDSSHNSINENDENNYDDGGYQTPEEENSKLYGGRRLGSFNPARTVEAAQTPRQSNSLSQLEAQALAESEREARNLRELRAEAASRRISRPLGSSSTSGLGSGFIGRPYVPVLSIASSTSTISDVSRAVSVFSLGATEQTVSTVNSSAPSTAPPNFSSANLLAQLLPDRIARIQQQQREQEITERLRKKKELADKEARRVATLTPKERMEKQIKDKAMLEEKERRARDEAERDRIQREIEADKIIRREKAEAQKEKREREKAAKEAKEAVDRAARRCILEEIEREERERRAQ